MCVFIGSVHSSVHPIIAVLYWQPLWTCGSSVLTWFSWEWRKDKSTRKWMEESSYISNSFSLVPWIFFTFYLSRSLILISNVTNVIKSSLGLCTLTLHYESATDPAKYPFLLSNTWRAWLYRDSGLLWNSDTCPQTYPLSHFLLVCGFEFAFFFFPPLMYCKIFWN